MRTALAVAAFAAIANAQDGESQACKDYKTANPGYDATSQAFIDACPDHWETAAKATVDAGVDGMLGSSLPATNDAAENV